MLSDSSTYLSVWARIKGDISKYQEKVLSFDIRKLAEEQSNLAKYRPVRIGEMELAEISSGAREIKKRLGMKNIKNNIRVRTLCKERRHRNEKETIVYQSGSCLGLDHLDVRHSRSR